MHEDYTKYPLFSLLVDVYFSFSKLFFIAFHYIDVVFNVFSVCSFWGIRCPMPPISYGLLRHPYVMYWQYITCRLPLVLLQNTPFSLCEYFAVEQRQQFCVALLPPSCKYFRLGGGTGVSGLVFLESREAAKNRYQVLGNQKPALFRLIHAIE